jgi:hypothetical protein
MVRRLAQDAVNKGGAFLQAMTETIKAADGG